MLDNYYIWYNNNVLKRKYKNKKFERGSYYGKNDKSTNFRGN